MNSRLLVVASAACFGTLGTFSKLVYVHGGDPLTLLFVRFVISFVLLAAIVVLHGRHATLRAYAAGVALGLVFYLGQSLTFFEGLDRAPASLVVLLFYIWPFFVTIAGRVFFREALPARRLAILVIGLAGVALAIGVPGRSTTLGVALGLVSGLFYAGYIVGGKQLMRATLTPYQLTAAALAGPMVVYAGVSAYRGLDLPSGSVGWTMLLSVAIVGTVIPTLFLFAGLSRIEAGTASILSTAEPVVGVLLAVAILGESFTPIQALGAALVVGAVATLASPARRRAGTAGEPPR